jgi:hypothetical protein
MVTVFSGAYTPAGESLPQRLNQQLHLFINVLYFLIKRSAIFVNRLGSKEGYAKNFTKPCASRAG